MNGQKVRFFHYVPRPEYRSKDASDWAHSLNEHITRWICEALNGSRRRRLVSSSSKLIARSQDEIRCDIAQALAACPEWDGFSIAHALKERGWPADVDLVFQCNIWSSNLWPKIKARLAAGGRNLRGDAA
jgi:hypothetical protein